MKAWQDFNNTSVEVEIDNSKYNSVLYVENEMLKLKVDCTKNIEKFNSNINIIDIINGKIIKDSTKVTFINCFHYGIQSIGVGENEYIYSIYRIDRVFLGINLNNIQIKEISACKVVYQSIDDFFDDKIFNVDFVAKGVQILLFCKEHKYLDDKMNFVVLSDIEENINEGFVKLSKKIVVDLKSNKKACLDDIIRKIYIFRNLMMILLKRNVIVKEQILKINDKKCELLDCYNYELAEKSENLKNQLIFRKV